MDATEQRLARIVLGVVTGCLLAVLRSWSTCRATPPAASGATARRTTRWRRAWPRTGTCATRPTISSASARRTREDRRASSSSGPGGPPLLREGLRLSSRCGAGGEASRPRSRPAVHERPLPVARALARIPRAAPRCDRSGGVGGDARVVPGHGHAAVPVLADARDPEPRPDHGRARCLAPRRGRCSRPCSSAWPTYSKPTNLLLAIPLGLEPFLTDGLARGLRESVRRGVVLAAVVLAGFGLTLASTGEANYQGGERKTFYDAYPFESPQVTFDTAGIWMTTEHVGPLVAGRDEEKQSARIAPVRAAEELRQSYLWNLGYFWIGRFGGAVPYFLPGVLAALLFLLAGTARPRRLARPARARGLVALLHRAHPRQLVRRERHGGEPLFREPAAALPLPRAPDARMVGGRGGSGGDGRARRSRSLRAPIHHSRNPGEHATWRAFRAFPVELTMLGDLSVFTDVWRRRRPYNHPEAATRERGWSRALLPLVPGRRHVRPGDLVRRGRVLDARRAGRRGDRAGAPPRRARIRLKVTAGPAGDIVTVRLGASARASGHEDAGDPGGRLRCRLRNRLLRDERVYPAARVTVRRRRRRRQASARLVCEGRPSLSQGHP